MYRQSKSHHFTRNNIDFLKSSILGQKAQQELLQQQPQKPLRVEKEMFSREKPIIEKKHKSKFQKG